MDTESGRHSDREMDRLDTYTARQRLRRQKDRLIKVS